MKHSPRWDWQSVGGSTWKDKIDPQQRLGKTPRSLSETEKREGGLQSTANEQWGETKAAEKKMTWLPRSVAQSQGTHLTPSSSRVPAGAAVHFPDIALIVGLNCAPAYSTPIVLLTFCLFPLLECQCQKCGNFSSLITYDISTN